MAELSNEAVERLLLLMANYGQMVSRSLADVAPDPELVSNVSLVVLCSLDLDGPRRPGVLQELTGLSSGGVSKLLDRMEQAGVVKRTYGGVPGDNRGVLVSITRRGRALAGRFAGALAVQLPDAKALVKEIAATLEV
jgi:DNA-binding MarR family transcriptional regulator